jgi:3-dehydroquinate synthase
MALPPQHIILAGFMGTGKTAVGKALATALGRGFIDTDRAIETGTGKTVSQIFAQTNEENFRDLEAKAIQEALRQPPAVIAVGGGAVCNRDNLRRLQRGGSVILLRANLETILGRVAKKNSRPLLSGENPRAKAEALLRQREPHYSKISVQISTDGKSVPAIADEIMKMLSLQNDTLTLKLGSRSYPLYFVRNSMEQFPALLRRHFSGEKLAVVSDVNVQRHFGKKFLGPLKKEFQVHLSVLPPGEKSKNLGVLQKLFKEWVRAQVDRQTAVVALGGGVIGDLAGFAAATFLRGIPFVQVPTTLLAQVDSSIGGKTGVDLPEGKNLVGAFYQPRFVFVEESFLKTLPRREFIGGMAEVIKYAAIFDASLFRDLERRMPELLRNQGESIQDIVRACCEWKAWVVEKDEKETLGLRSKLNFGHTLGHAIESLTGYRRFTHGEAIAMGMVFAARKSVAKTGLPPSQVERIVALLGQAGLPTEMPGFKKNVLLAALRQDKKRVSSQLHFVYLEKIGKSAVLPTPLNEVL